MCMYGLLLEGLLDGAAEPIQSIREAAGDVHPQGAPAAFGKDLEIAARLRLLDDAKGIGLAGHRQIVGIVTGDLQEDAGVRPALIGLSRRVLEARPEADTRCRPRPVANDLTDSLQHIEVGGP